MLPLEVHIDAMSNVRSRLIAMRDSVNTADFEDLGGPMPEFGRFDKCGLLHRDHSLAHGLMLETLEAVAASIAALDTSLVAARDAFDDADQDVRAQMIAHCKAVEALNDSSYLPGTDDARDRYRTHHQD